MRLLLKDFSDSKDKTEAFETQYLQMRQCPQIRVFIFFLNGRPVGLYVGNIKITFFDSSLFVDCVVTAKSARGVGVGKEMAIHMIEYARSYELDQVELMSSKPVAQNLYRAAGLACSSTGFRYKN